MTWKQVLDLLPTCKILREIAGGGADENKLKEPAPGPHAAGGDGLPPGPSCSPTASRAQSGHKGGEKGTNRVFWWWLCSEVEESGVVFFFIFIFQALQVLLPQQSPCWDLSAPKSQHCWIRIPDQWDEIVGGQAELWGVPPRGSPSPAEPRAALAVSCHFFLPVIYLIFPSAASGRVAMGTQQQPRLSRRRAPGARHLGRMRPRHPWVPPPQASAPSHGTPCPPPRPLPKAVPSSISPGDAARWQLVVPAHGCPPKVVQKSPSAAQGSLQPAPSHFWGLAPV